MTYSTPLRLLLACLFFLLNAGNLIAQKPGSPDATDPAATGNRSARITGYVVDSTLAGAVEYANIALYNTATGKLIDGTVADAKGRFSLNRVAPGSYRLLVSFLGFSNKSIDNLLISRNQTLDLGVIRLRASPRTLNEVTVTGQKALVEDRVDRLVYNADRDLTAKGGDATDVLKKVPLLSVDLAGNVSLQGSANVRVLINNKPSSILAGNLADALRQIPADLIKTVEVITSPSAKYDAEGSGGIINIITRKNTLQGLHADLDGGLGNRASTAGLNVSFRRGKLGLNMNGNGRAIYNKTASDLEQTTYPGAFLTPVRTRQHTDGRDTGLSGQYALGLDYDLDKNQSLTAGLRLGLRDLTREQHFLTNGYTGEVIGKPATRDVVSQDLSNSVDANVDYLHTYGPQRELSISAQFSQNHLTNNFDANLLDSTQRLTSRQRNLNFNTNQEFVIQADYQMPLAKNQQLEFGLKDTRRQVNSTYQYLLASPASDYATDTRRPAGSLDYAQNIAAGYLSFTHTTTSRVTVKAGVRYEYTSIAASATGQGAGPIAVPDYGKLIPSLNLSKKIGESTTLRLALSRRIQRPGIQDLNPNFNAANPLNIRIGNPYLKPEIADKIEAGYSTYIKKTYLNLTLYARLNADDIQAVSRRSDTLAGAVVSRVQNVGKEYNYGTNLFTTVNLTPRWTLNANLEVMYRYITALALDLSGVSVSVSNTGLRIGGRFDTQLQLDRGWAVQANFGYRGRDVQVQGYRVGFAQYALGARKEFANKRGSLGLTAENFLTRGQQFTSVLNSAQFDQDFRQYVYNSNIRLTLNYKLGSLTNRPKKGKSDGGEDDQN